MKDKSPYSHAFRLDMPIKLATDNIFGHIPTSGFNPGPPPPMVNIFLLSDGTDFLLSDGMDFLLS